MKIALTGGGTAGHVMVNSVLIPMLRDGGWDTIYIGSHSGAERDIIEKQGIAGYRAVSTGKLRRYLSLQNLLDCFRVAKGFFEALALLRREKPQVICSGGGFVSVPVVLAGRVLGIPVVIRETDYSVGLANRICMKHAGKVFTTFEDTVAGITEAPSEYGGLIVRPELLETGKDSSFGFADSRPVLLVLGGSLGSRLLNEAVRASLDLLLCDYNVLHLCGKGNLCPELEGNPRYRQYEYIDGMTGVYRAADIVMTRCGSNAVSEGLALGKRLLCVPMSNRYSRGEQMQNALYAVRVGTAVVLDEDGLSPDSIICAIQRLMTLPQKNGRKLTPALLRKNCRRQIDELRRLAVGREQKELLKSLRRGKKIDWHKLNDRDMRFFEEISEECELCF